MEEGKMKARSPCLGPLWTHVLPMPCAWFFWPLHYGLWKPLSVLGSVKLVNDIIKKKNGNDFKEVTALENTLEKSIRCRDLKNNDHQNQMCFLKYHVIVLLFKKYFSGLQLRLLGPVISHVQMLTLQGVGTLCIFWHYCPQSEWNGISSCLIYHKCNIYQGPDSEIPQISSH